MLCSVYSLKDLPKAGGIYAFNFGIPTPTLAAVIRVTATQRGTFDAIFRTFCFCSCKLQLTCFCLSLRYVV